MSDTASWAAVGVSVLALGNSIWTRLAAGYQRRKNAIKQILDHWETGSRLRNLTIRSDAFMQGLSKSVKAWRGVCQDGLEAVRSGRERTLIREAQKAAIPVDSILDSFLAGDMSGMSRLDDEITRMQEHIELRMQDLAKSTGRDLEPREREL